MAYDKLQFLQGTQTALDAMTSSQSGAFYLTTDTHRLYIGEGEKPVPVNEGVTVLKDVSELTDDLLNKSHPGQFYLISKDNILATVSNGTWVQINPTTEITAVGVNNSAVTENKEVKAEISVSSTRNGVKETKKQDLVFYAGDGISLTVESGKIKIASTGTGGSSTKVSARSQDSKAYITQVITTTPLDGGQATTAESNGVELAAGNYIDNIAVTDDSGDTPAKVTINAKEQAVSSINLISEDEGFNVSLSQTNSSDKATVTGTKINPTIKFGKDGNISATFKNGIATLSAYTKAETDTAIEDAINKKIQVADAMTFMGVVTSQSGIDSVKAKARKGDTYKATAPFKLTLGTEVSEDVKIGDLIIFDGTEDTTTGYITAASLTAYVIPSGNEYETAGENLAHGIRLTQNDTNKSLIAGLSLAEGTCITLADTEDTTNGKVVTVTHSNVSCSKGDATDTEITYSDTSGTRTGDITAIDSITVNGQGHVTAFTTKKYKVKDTHVTGVTHTVEQTANTNIAKINTTVTDGQGTTTAANVSLTGGSSVKLSTSSNNITIDMVWGSF